MALGMLHGKLRGKENERERRSRHQESRRVRTEQGECQLEKKNKGWVKWSEEA